MSPPAWTETLAAALRRWGAKAPPGTRGWVLGLVGVAGAVFLGRWLNGRQPMHAWLAIDLAVIWLWQATLAAACAAVGYRLASRLLPARGWTALEKLAIGYPAGVVIFVLGIYAAGFLHLLGPALAVALPGLLLAIGAPTVIRDWRGWRGASASDPGPLRLDLGGLALLATGFGLVLLGVLYLGAMSPDAINYDASWNHLVIAQDYAREGKIVPFPGDWIKNLPHLGSVLNTWSFLVPGLDPPALRWMMALHTEWVAFIGTLVGVAAAARWIADRQQPAMWTAFALFPGIFAYDSNLGGAADHFLGLFAAPLLLLTGKALPRVDRNVCLLWGLLGGGALLTKAQGVYLVAPLGLLLAARAAHLALSRRRGDAAGPSPAALAKTAALSAGVMALVLLPHLGSNFVFFRNPLYPLLQDVFTASSPTVDDAASHVKYLLADWRYRAPEPLWDRLKDAVRVVFTFSFVPHYSYVNELPVFGSVFTLSLPLLLLLRGARRLWLGALMAVAVLFAWAATYRVDRNLQGMTPAFIAVTAAIIARAWEEGLFARIGVAALVAVQLTWAGNIYFQGADRISGAANLLKSTMTGRADEALGRYRREYVALGASLPADATLMLHTSHSMLGINRRVLLDWIGFQGLFDYRRYRTPRDLWDRLRALGVTHVAWTTPAIPARSKQEELIFDAFVDAHARETRSFGAVNVIPLPAMPPPPSTYAVLMVGVAGYADGLYPVEALSTCEELPPHLQRHPSPSKLGAGSAWTLLDEANAVFVGAQVRSDDGVTTRLHRDFRQIRGYPAFRLLLRR